MRRLRASAACILLAGFAVSGGARAQDETVDCDAANTQAAMNVCADRDYQVADKALNAAYRETLRRAQTADRELAGLGAGMAGAVDALKAAQRAWIGYRDGQCTLAGFEARGGSMEPMLVSGCLADLTRKHTDELNEALKDP